jgi:hypothetical protein
MAGMKEFAKLLRLALHRPKAKKKKTEQNGGSPVKKRRTKTILGMGVRPGMLSVENRKSSLSNIVDGPLMQYGGLPESRAESPEVQVIDGPAKGEYRA